MKQDTESEENGHKNLSLHVGVEYPLATSHTRVTQASNNTMMCCVDDQENAVVLRSIQGSEKIGQIRPRYAAPKNNHNKEEETCKQEEPCW